MAVVVVFRKVRRSVFLRVMDGLGFCRWVALGTGIDDGVRRSTGETFTFPTVHRGDSFGGLEAAFAEGKVVVVVPQGNREGS